MAVIDKYGRVHNYGYFYNPEVSSPYISIKPNYMCTYLRHFSHKPPSDSSGALCSRCHNLLSSDEYSAHPGLCNSCVNLTNNKSSGDISSAGRSRLLLAFDWMLLFSKSKQAYNDNLKSYVGFGVHDLKPQSHSIYSKLLMFYGKKLDTLPVNISELRVNFIVNF